MLETTTLEGVINGDTIKLNSDPHFANGKKVRVTIYVDSENSSTQPTSEQKKLRFEEAVRRTAGAAANDPHADADFEEIYQARKNSKPREIPED